MTFGCPGPIWVQVLGEVEHASFFDAGAKLSCGAFEMFLTISSALPENYRNPGQHCHMSWFIGNPSGVSAFRINPLGRL